MKKDNDRILAKILKMSHPEKTKIEMAFKFGVNIGNSEGYTQGWEDAKKPINDIAF